MCLFWLFDQSILDDFNRCQYPSGLLKIRCLQFYSLLKVGGKSCDIIQWKWHFCIMSSRFTNIWAAVDLDVFFPCFCRNLFMMKLLHKSSLSSLSVAMWVFIRKQPSDRVRKNGKGNTIRITTITTIDSCQYTRQP